MALLGKRKSRDGETASADVSELDAAAIFRRHFEAQFEPLDEEDEAARAQREQDDDDEVDSDLNGDDDDDDDDDDSDDADEWGGFSGAEDKDSEDSDDEDTQTTAAVEVIDHSKPQIPKEPQMSKKELKAFMSSKVIDHTAPQPSPSSSSAAASAKPAKALPEDAPSLLAQDLELRRLLSESHLLTPSHNNAASASVFSSSVVHGTAAEPRAFSSGRTRQRATDLRLQALGSKGSVLAQERMPMSMRKGIAAAADARDAKRRREAKENGVILERSAQTQGRKKGGGGGSSRGRGGGDVHSPGIGRMRGAELRISESDVRKIEGSRDAFGRKGRGGGRR
ncbi:hypothetical protein LMH87_004246 [Akanthomyces muscarius]|uniref:Protein FAF1 n=1 Tax=Akanthomyces muscarius TaxID=2231603 RepID=A0A9W8UHW3_AKAMU|nr:hypothetical protein LMH87_004246 [Akanthomyces muscarius]KAJ4145394.1 hypothetical protein LMH87_004246 [Akanthomyces muscarius]